MTYATCVRRAFRAFLLAASTGVAIAGAARASEDCDALTGETDIIELGEFENLTLVSDVVLTFNPGDEVTITALLPFGVRVDVITPAGASSFDNTAGTEEESYTETHVTEDTGGSSSANLTVTAQNTRDAELEVQLSLDCTSADAPPPPPPPPADDEPPAPDDTIDPALAASQIDAVAPLLVPGGIDGDIFAAFGVPILPTSPVSRKREEPTECDRCSGALERQRALLAQKEAEAEEFRGGLAAIKAAAALPDDDYDTDREPGIEAMQRLNPEFGGFQAFLIDGEYTPTPEAAAAFERERELQGQAQRLAREQASNDEIVAREERGLATSQEFFRRAQADGDAQDAAEHQSAVDRNLQRLEEATQERENLQQASEQLAEQIEASQQAILEALAPIQAAMQADINAQVAEAVQRYEGFLAQTEKDVADLKEQIATLEADCAQVCAGSGQASARFSGARRALRSGDGALADPFRLRLFGAQFADGEGADADRFLFASNPALTDGRSRPRRQGLEGSFLLSDARLAATASGEPLPGLLGDDRFNLWVNAGVTFNRDDRAGFGQEGETVTVATGVSYQVSPRVTLGASTRYARADLDGATGATIGETMSYGVFAQTRLVHDVTLSSMLAYSDADIETHIVQGALTADGETQLDSLAAQLSLSRSFAAGRWTISPSAGASYVTISRDAMTASDGAVVSGEDTSQLSISAGPSASTRFETRLPFWGVAEVSPNFGLNAYANVGRFDQEVGADGGPERVEGFGMSASSGLGLRFENGASLGVSASVAGLVQDQQTLSVNARFSLPF